MAPRLLRIWSDLGKSPGIFVSIVVTIASIALATGLTVPIANVAIHSRSLFLIVAVMFCAWYGGAWSGMFAAVLSVLSFDYFFDQTPGVIDFTLAAALRAIVFMIAALFVTYLTSQRNQALLDALSTNKALEKALEEIRVLRGILPICMSCKQIRNDAGLWEDVVRYISEHTDAKFSHGYCPECLRKLYPEAAAKLQASDSGRIGKDLDYGTNPK